MLERLLTLNNSDKNLFLQHAKRIIVVCAIFDLYLIDNTSPQRQMCAESFVACLIPIGDITTPKISGIWVISHYYARK